VLGTIGKPSVRTDARALIHGIWTYGGKVIEFQSFYDLLKLENYFYLHFACVQRHTGTLVGYEEQKFIVFLNKLF